MSEALQQIISIELNKRKKKNPKYSLRAFSRDLGVSPALLSVCLNKKSDIGHKHTKKILDQLCPGANTNAIVFDKKHQKENSQFMRSLKKMKEKIEVDNFENKHLLMYTDYRYSIVASYFTLSEQFQNNDQFIKKLKITRMEFDQIVVDLLELGYVIKDSEGKLKGSNTSKLNMDFKRSAPARKQFQKNVLNSAIQAMDEVSIEERLQSSFTLSMSSKKIETAKEQIMEFLITLSHLLTEGDDEKDEVYQMSFSFFPIMRLNK